MKEATSTCAIFWQNVTTSNLGEISPSHLPSAESTLQHAGEGVKENAAYLSISLASKRVLITTPEYVAARLLRKCKFGLHG
jgi:hypothetical protein